MVHPMQARLQTSVSASPAERVTHPGRRWVLPASVTGLLLAWEAAVRWTGYPAYILPAPSAIASRLVSAVLAGDFEYHLAITVLEVVLGLGLGLVVAAVLGYALARSPVAEETLAPYIVSLQAIPMPAVAPLLYIWFGVGLLPRVLVCSLIVFFPVLVNLVVGLRSVEPELYDLMRTLKAGRWQILTKLELPAALPVLLGGLKIGATLAVIGAVVGEFLGGNQGLGYLVN